jgi:hypothetical protein
MSKRTKLFTTAAPILAAVAWVTPAAAGTPEAVVACSATSATAPAFAACVASFMSAEEANKCFASAFKDCFGPNNELSKIINRNVVGPLNDLGRGEIGASDQSVWRKDLHLPRLKLWP